MVCAIAAQNISKSARVVRYVRQLNVKTTEVPSFGVGKSR